MEASLPEHVTMNKTYFFCIALCTIFFSCSTSEEKPKPNIVLIFTDDLGWGDIGVNGQKLIKTPNIDALAKEGMQFTQFYAGGTVCAPSRSALLTGKHTGHTSVRANDMAKTILLDPEEETMTKALKRAGYKTAMFGKWGIGHEPPKNDPELAGFDEFYGYLNMWHAHNLFPEFLYENGEKVALANKLRNINGENPWKDMPEGTGVSEIRNEYSIDNFDKKATDYIKKNKDQPFFLMLSLNIPHANNEATGDDLGMEIPNSDEYADQDWPQNEKNFAAVVTRIDRTVEKVMKTLREQGLEENTLVIFTSDNGPHNEGGHDGNFFDSNGEFRGFKRDFYEGGIHMPMIAYWKGKIAPASKSDFIGANWDFMPTFCDLAVVTYEGDIDGVSFLPTLLGQNQEKKHDYLYWEFYEQGGKQAIRWDKWKGIKLNTRTFDENGIIELYDLSTDVSEKNNVADQNPEIVNTILKKMEEAHEPQSYVSLFSLPTEIEKNGY